jgi:hypothetical protein
MSELYRTLEKEVDELDSIENWNEKINKMRDIKQRVAAEQHKLNGLINSILKNEINVELDLETGIELDTLISSFRTSNSIEDKLKYYYLINGHINQVTEELFNN